MFRELHFRCSFYLKIIYIYIFVKYKVEFSPLFVLVPTFSAVYLNCYTILFDLGLLEQADGKPQTAQDLLALLRDQKRRRQSYRAKNVHITRKSYTEVQK